MVGFAVTRGTGFHITFENGKTVSIQIGAGTYSDNHDKMDFGSGKAEPSQTAEVAVFGPSGELEHRQGWGGDSVCGYQTPDQVLELLKEVSKE